MSDSSEFAKVLIVDDHAMMRQGLSSMLEDYDQVEVVAEAADGRQALRQARLHQPDIVLMDVGMPNLNGFDATRQIMRAVPHARVIALSMYDDSQFVGRMLGAGAAGYLLKDGAFEEVIEAIETIRAGRLYLGQGITHVVVGDPLRVKLPGAQTSLPLSQREREVLQLLAEGRTTKQIAAALFISVKTVETHRQRIMDKLDIRSIAELTKYAIREGLTNVQS
jgi:DNA-binding NarL/FixJ family response regulator